MRAILLAALLAAGPALSEESPFLRGADLQAEIARNCDAGCVVLSPAEAQAIMAQVAALVQAREQAAKEAAESACKNRI